LEIKDLPVIQKIFRTDANFLLMKVDDAAQLYNYLSKQGLIVRDRSSQYNCENCLRVTIGTKVENDTLIALLHSFCEQNTTKN
jgi:histidinol-phosphate aminotransferase